jgi:hypothetical protein
MLLLHGTTRQRAESIMQNGPDAHFREPNGPTAEGFSTAIAEGSPDVGSPEMYARGKAAAFPNEGGPAILTFELADDLADNMIGGLGELIAGKAFNAGTEIRFEVWPQLTKMVTLL